MIKVYAYTGCSTCRNALKFLQERQVAHEVIAIRETPPTKAELKRMLAVYGGALRKLFNTAGQDYRALGIGEQLDGLTVDQALTLLNGNGNLVKRPFALTKESGAVGFKPEEWEKLI